MRHARPEDLDRIEELLAALRALPLNERGRGLFCRKGRAFLHFHEHDGALFADLRGDDGFDRLEVTSRAQQRALLAHARARAGQT